MPKRQVFVGVVAEEVRNKPLGLTFTRSFFDTVTGEERLKRILKCMRHIGEGIDFSMSRAGSDGPVKVSVVFGKDAEKQ